jgi:hypothetical protein
VASPDPAFTKRQQLLSPDQYELVDVRTRSGVRRAMLFPEAILQAEFAANAPMRQRMAINRERLRAKRAAQAGNYRGKLRGVQRRGGCPEEHSRAKKELQDYAEQTSNVCRFEGVAKRQRLLSSDQYQTAGWAYVPWCETGDTAAPEGDA